MTESQEIYVQDRKVEIFIKGQYLESDKNAVAIVGSREATPNGRALAHRFAYMLAKEGITIVAGLAVGIDTMAHRGALDAKGRTIAVLGHGLDVPIYPKENTDLAKKVIANGCLISPYKNNFAPTKKSFVDRNAIIVALSKCVLIVEGQLDSGTQTTAKHSADLNVEVFAVPGSPLTDFLIESGTSIANSSEDILDYLSSIS